MEKVKRKLLMGKPDEKALQAFNILRDNIRILVEIHGHSNEVIGNCLCNILVDLMYFDGFDEDEASRFFQFLVSEKYKLFNELENERRKN